jgi:hypothetical protein
MFLSVGSIEVAFSLQVDRLAGASRYLEVWRIAMLGDRLDVRNDILFVAERDASGLELAC